MHIPEHLCPTIAERLKELFNSDQPAALKVQAAWINILSYNTAIMAQGTIEKVGKQIYKGPFKGMKLIDEVITGSILPKILGAYEWELHESIETITSKPYKNILNIGSAFGYYAIGFALRMPDVTVYAHDIDETCQSQCKKMALHNGVADRVKVGGLLTGEDFEKFKEEETLVFMDIEGAEEDLLDPRKYPALLNMDIVVELHDCNTPDLSTKLPKLFEETHTLQIIKNKTMSFPMTEIFGEDYYADHFDDLMATWESRGGRTPYGVFIRK